VLAFGPAASIICFVVLRSIVNQNIYFNEQKLAGHRAQGRIDVLVHFYNGLARIYIYGVITDKLGSVHQMYYCLTGLLGCPMRTFPVLLQHQNKIFAT